MVFESANHLKFRGLLGTYAARLQTLNIHPTRGENFQIHDIFEIDPSNFKKFTMMECQQHHLGKIT